MDGLTLLAGLALPWLLGIAVVLALRPAAPESAAPGEMAWVGGAGYLAGAFLLTLWMRALSLAGIKFAVASIGLPLAIIAIACAIVAWRRHGTAMPHAFREAAIESFAARGVAPAMRWAWRLLLAWLAVRFVLLAVEVMSRPLYPWDAWTQWATKARVWYELGYLAPFARVNAWFAANGAVYFDASPDYPPTMPLLQVWSCLVLGRWDDVLMNWPWWQVGVALALAVYGGLRSLGVPHSAHSSARFSSPRCRSPTCIWHSPVIPTCRWPRGTPWRRSRSCAGIAPATGATPLLRCSLRSPARRSRIRAGSGRRPSSPASSWRCCHGTAFAWPPSVSRRPALLLVAAARFKLTVFNYQIDLNFDPAWGDLSKSYFLLGNWHLLWFGAIGVAVLAWRQLLSPAMAPLTMIVVGGLLFLFFVFAFTNASAYIADQTTVNRATLHLAPLIMVFMVLAWQAFAQRWIATHPAPEGAVAEPAGGTSD